MTSRPVLIVGAGIAGPAAGIALARAGIEALVYEASSTPRDEAGAFLNLAPNGIAVLRALAVEHVLDALGFQNDRLVFRNESGRVLAETAVGGVTVMRGALSRTLREAAQQLGWFCQSFCGRPPSPPAGFTITVSTGKTGSRQRPRRRTPSHATERVTATSSSPSNSRRSPAPCRDRACTVDRQHRSRPIQ